MRKKSLSSIIGYGLLIGAALYWGNKFVNKDSFNDYNEDSTKEKDLMDISPEKTLENDVINLDVIKMQSANSMYDRHEYASQVVKESIKKINENTYLTSEHEEEFNIMFAEVDILSE